MQRTPKRETKKLSALIAALLLCAALAFFFGSRIPYGVILQAFSLCLFSAFLFLCIRYVLPEYRYELDGSTLTVRRAYKSGRVMTLCRLDLEELISIECAHGLPDDKKSYDLCYNFCQNLFSENRIRILLIFNRKRALLLLDYDEVLYRALSALPVLPTGSDNDRQR